MAVADPVPDLNQTIASAVQARVQAEVLAALSGDAVFGQLVAASMNGMVEVPDGSYGKKRVTFMQNVLTKTIQKATQAAVQEVVNEEHDRIKEQVKKSLRRNLDAIAEGLTDQAIKSAKSPYGWDISVNMKWPRENE